MRPGLDRGGAGAASTAISPLPTGNEAPKVLSLATGSYGDFLVESRPMGNLLLFSPMGNLLYAVILILIMGAGRWVFSVSEREADENTRGCLFAISCILFYGALLALVFLVNALFQA